MLAYLAWRSRVRRARLRTSAFAAGVQEARQLLGQSRRTGSRSPARKRWSSRLTLSSVFWSWTSMHSAGVRTEWLMRRPESQSRWRNAEMASLRSGAMPLGVEQQQQIDVGVGEQLAPAVAAHRQQGQIPRARRETAVPTRPRSTHRSTSAVRSASAVRASPDARKFCSTGDSLESRFPAVVVADPDGFGHVVDENLCRRRSCRCAPPPSALDHFVAARWSGTTISSFTLGSRSTLYSWPR